MLDLLDNLIRRVLLDGVAALRDMPLAKPPAPPLESQVSFDAPDTGWRTNVKNNQRNTINVYLVDLRENRRLRSNERMRTNEGGIVLEEPAPTRLECHYLITAWSPAQHITPQIEATLDEHALLYQTAAVLFRNAPLNPARAYPSGSAPLNGWPARFRNVDLPTTVAPPEGFNKLSEFWTNMGQDAPWKPSVYLVVTLPIELIIEVAGPMVTTRITEYRQDGQPSSAETWVQIGGQVLTPAGVTVADAWVQIETRTGAPLETTRTNELGRFTFADLRPDQYRLRARVAGLGEKSREVNVPAHTGEYDIRFT